MSHYDTLKAQIASEFGTPAAVIDLDIVDANITSLQARCDAAGIANRPHIKTHKSPVLACQHQHFFNCFNTCALLACVTFYQHLKWSFSLLCGLCIGA